MNRIIVNYISFTIRRNVYNAINIIVNFPVHSYSLVFVYKPHKQEHDNSVTAGFIFKKNACSINQAHCVYLTQPILKLFYILI